MDFAELLSCVLQFLKIPSSWISLFAPLFLFLLGFGYLQIILASFALIFSSFLFKPSNQCQETEPENVAESRQEEKDEEEEEEDLKDQKFLKSPNSVLESQYYQSSNTEDSDESETWNYQENRDFSDGSISDDDSLFELSLPSGHYIGKEEETRKSFQEFIPQTVFQERMLTEMLAELNEMNEEDNLIEIDISMGSIKCSRFQIPA